MGVLALGAATEPAAGQSAADSAAILGAARDYIEGWDTGDAKRVRRAVHPDLVKRMIQTNGTISEMDAETLARMAGMRGSGGGDGSFVQGIEILTVFQDVAAVRIDTATWVDLLHVARFGDDWKIVNVLWDPNSR